MSILDLPGPEFLRLFWGLLAGAVVLGVAIRMWMRRPWDDGGSAGALEPYEVAFLRAGPGGAVDAAVASMAHREIVMPYNAKREPKLRQARALPLEASEIERKIYHVADRGAAVRKVRQAGWAATEPIRETLVEQGLWLSDGRYLAARLGAVLPGVLCFLLGVTKVGIGFSRGRPVGYLVMLCFGTLIGVIVGLVRCNRRTVRGQRLLQSMVRENAPLRTTTATAGTAGLGATDVALAFALFGGVALADERMRPTREALQQGGADTSSSSSSSSSCSSGSSCSSSSSSDGGGSSCGGGGGCGGCGGGGGD